MDTNLDKIRSVSDAEQGQRGGIVPAAAGSSSSYGPTRECKAGSRGEAASAVPKEKRKRKRKDPPPDDDADASDNPSQSSNASKLQRKSLFSDDDFDSDTSMASLMSSVSTRTDKSRSDRRTRSSGPITAGVTAASSGTSIDVDMEKKKDPRKVNFEDLTIDELFQFSKLSLDRIDEIRKSSVNIMKGELNGHIKKELYTLRETLNILVARADKVQDTSTSFMRTRIMMLTREKKDLQHQIDTLRVDDSASEKMIRSLRDKLRKSKEDTRRVTCEGTYLAERAPLPVTDEDDVVVMRPPLGGVSVPVPTGGSRPCPKSKKEKSVGAPAAGPKKPVKGKEVPEKKKEEPSPSATYSKAAGGTGPRVIENRKVKGVIIREDPNRTEDASSADEAGWDKVRKRGRHKAKVSSQQPPKAVLPPPDGKKKKPDVVRGRRVPRTAAVVLTDTADPMSSGKLLGQARKGIDLPGLGIESSKVRRAAAGGVVIEISGAENASKADILAAKLRDFFAADVRVSRPIVKGELRVIGIDDSVTPEELKQVIATQGGCKEEEVQVGVIRTMTNGLGIVWTKCPLQAAVSLAAKAKLRIGWTTARVELLKARPTQCHQCWQYGHMRSSCPSTVDRSAACYNCGGTGHTIRGCTNAPHCAVCAEGGKDASHRLGSAKCGLEKKSGIKVDFRAKATASNRNTTADRRATQTQSMDTSND